MDEAKNDRAKRDAAICERYLAGCTMVECAREFHLSRPRIQQILKKGGAWHPYVKGDRTQFLGVSVTEEDKAALRVEAERRGLSMSALTSDAIRKMLAELKEGRNGDDGDGSPVEAGNRPPSTDRPRS